MDFSDSDGTDDVEVVRLEETEKEFMNCRCMEARIIMIDSRENMMRFFAIDGNIRPRCE